MYHRPVCVKCNREMRPERNEVGCLDMAEFGPYKLWDSDLYKCPNCGYEILTGFGEHQIAEHYQEGFKPLLAHWQEHSLVIESRG